MRHLTVTLSNTYGNPNGDHACCFSLGNRREGFCEAAGFFCGDGGVTTDDRLATAVQAADLLQSLMQEYWESSVNATASDRARSSLHSALARANSWLFERSMESSPVREQHISEAAGIIYRGILVFQNVGNVRVMLARGGECHVLSEDQSYAASLERRGLLQASSALRHPYASLSTRRLGGEPDFRPRFRSVVLRPDDLLFVVTDGLRSLRSPETMQRIVDGVTAHADGTGGRPIDYIQEIGWRLISACESVTDGREDDATALIVGIEEDDMFEIPLENLASPTTEDYGSREEAPGARRATRSTEKRRS